MSWRWVDTGLGVGEGEQTADVLHNSCMLFSFQAEISMNLKKTMHLFLISATYQAFCTKHYTLKKKKILFSITTLGVGRGQIWYHRWES